jgi:hypothetical protein
MPKGNKQKHFCEACNYETDRLSSYKLHLTRNKHLKNTREGTGVKIQISKYKSQKFPKVHLEILPKNEIEPENKSVEFLESLGNELTQLRNENLLLKINMQNQFNGDRYDEFTSIFDDNFDVLFA